ncbi:MAG: Hsp20/alpha crystallin family protein [Pirellula sp.]
MSTTLTPTRSASTGNSKDSFSGLRKDMEELLSNFWGTCPLGCMSQAMSPALDVIESENSFLVKMDAPGLQAKDLNVQVQGNTLTLSGQRQEDKETKDKTYYRMERRNGNFSRTVSLPCAVNESEAVAEYTNGVLTLTLPKAEGAKIKKITVKGS